MNNPITPKPMTEKVPANKPDVSKPHAPDSAKHPVESPGTPRKGTEMPKSDAPDAKPMVPTAAQGQGKNHDKPSRSKDQHGKSDAPGKPAMDSPAKHDK